MTKRPQGGRKIDMGSCVVEEVTAGIDPRASRHAKEAFGVGTKTPIPGSIMFDEVDKSPEAVGRRFQEFAETASDPKLIGNYVDHLEPGKLAALRSQLSVLLGLSERGIRLPLKLLASHAS